MKTKTSTAKIHRQAVKLAKDKQKTSETAGIPINNAVKGEIIKTATKEFKAHSIPMVDGKNEVTPEQYAIIEEACSKCATHFKLKLISFSSTPYKTNIPFSKSIH
jgi:hypothetical protein